ncbi:O-antigen ligase family protein [Sphingomonas sp. HF-S4]|uniref:O-antigen ligase family protein n=1 Tax=Sphingomonas agrestis TaxID=3080540 RepID=A0ABU3YAL6_9SPHN|nr:O-antigen ligase family protein [Sphingomonas sp. HF-S4]MDV3458439.1 O-antigen ligase family protein [Sphingomonas sp. HF-S4]
MSFARSLRQPDLGAVAPQTLILLLLTVLWFAGGASRGDALGQVVVRGAAWAIIAAAVLAGRRPDFGPAWPVALLLLATIALPLLQLIPLPPSWWQALPGRDILLLPGTASPPWRPWTMTPGATRNALAALVVPVAMLLLLAQLGQKERQWLPTIFLAMIVSAMLVGLLQFSGARFNNPLINETPGLVSGIFANRNHFALLLAIGCLLAPVWAFQDREALKWRGPTAIGLVLLFVLMILATGSRSGVLLGVLALVLAAMLVGRRLQRRLGQAPKWVFPALLAVAVAVIAGLIWLSVAADRAVSINRLIILDADEDLRTRAMPTIVSMIKLYFPLGSGFGGFDSLFRIHEPLALLKPTYFNQAHNDFLGIVLDGGLPALMLLGAALGWWLVASVRAWRAAPGEPVMLARLGSAILLLIFAASAFDYPVRTPTFMAFVVVAAVWLARGASSKVLAALPAQHRDL